MYDPPSPVMPPEFVALFFGTFFVSSILIAALVYAVQALALMFFFKRVGVEPWKAWVPFYNVWVWLEVGGQPGWLVLLALIPGGSIVTFVFLCIGMYRTGLAFGREGAWVVLAVFAPVVWLFVMAFAEHRYRPEVFAQNGWQGPYAGHGRRNPV